MGIPYYDSTYFCILMYVIPAGILDISTGTLDITVLGKKFSVQNVRRSAVFPYHGWVCTYNFVRNMKSTVSFYGTKTYSITYTKLRNNLHGYRTPTLDGSSSSSLGGGTTGSAPA